MTKIDVTKRIKVSRRVGLYSDFDGSSLVEVLQQIKELIDKHGGEAYLDHTEEDYSDYYVVRVMLSSMETDEEYNKRMSRIDEGLAYRKHQFESLKKEFEGDN
jgi:hypothetical protein